MYGATISEARQLESGMEIVLHTTDGRAEERLIRPDPMIGSIGDDSPG